MDTGFGTAFRFWRKETPKLCGRLPFDAAVRKDESGLFIQKEIGRVAVAQQMAALGISDGFALSAVALWDGR